MWLLKREVLLAMRTARLAGYEPTREERVEFARAMREAYAAGPDDRPHIMNVAGDTASISVEGVLTEKPDCWALMFGGGNATYEAIRKSLAMADADPSVKRIVLNIASPGGHVNGLFETFAALDAVQKPISVRSNFAASAAFGLAAVAGPIEATSPAAEFGSIGVAASFFVDDEVVDIASTEAPRKRPDVKTEEGVAMVREELDQLHELFAGRIANGRSLTTGEDITIKMVNSDFGQGGMFVAATAKKRGMIDKISAQPKRTRPGRGATEQYVPIVQGGEHHGTIARIGDPVSASVRIDGVELTISDLAEVQVQLAEPAVVAGPPINDASTELGGAEQPKEKKMTKDELKSQHPELFAAVLEDGIKSGTEQERKRVLDHIEMGDASGDMKIANAAIASGASVNDMQAKYFSARMRTAATQARQEETEEASAAVDGVKPKTTSTTREEVGDLVADIMDGKIKM